MHALLHDVAAAVVVIIVSCVIRVIVVIRPVSAAETADNKNPAMVESMTEAGVKGGIYRRNAARPNAHGTDTRRTDCGGAREATAKASGVEPGAKTATSASKTTAASAMTAESSTTMATTASTSRQGHVWGEHAD
jgi:hypothetical protein